MPDDAWAAEHVYFESGLLPQVLPEHPLYRLEPIGRGTGRAESLRSYLRRLAFAHHVSAAVLVKEVLRPLAIRSLGWAVPNPFNPPYRFVLGGIGRPTSMMVDVLQSATGYSQLESCTLLPLKPVVSAHGLLPAAPRHCPLCIARTVPGNYGRLLWEVGCVTACPVHEVDLVVSGCGAPPSEHLPKFRRIGLDGVCSRCGSIGYTCGLAARPASPPTVWEAAQVATLFGRISGGDRALDPETFREGLYRAAKIAGDGTGATAARRAGIPKSTLCEWFKGRHLPALGKVLTLCRVASVSLVSVVDGAPEIVASPTLDAGLPKRVQRRPRPTASERQTSLRDALLEIPAPSLTTVAKRIGVDRRTLVLDFPEMCAKLVEAGRNLLERDTADRDRAAQQKVRSALEMLQHQGRTPTVRNVEEVCGASLLPNGRLRKAFERTKETAATAD